MINKQAKFETKIPNCSLVVAFIRNHTKILSLKTNLALNIKVKDQQFSNSTEKFRLDDLLKHWFDSFYTHLVMVRSMTLT